MICYSVNLLSPFGDTSGEEVKLSVHFLVKNNMFPYSVEKNISFLGKCL